jgi:hypothetical protein
MRELELPFRIKVGDSVIKVTEHELKDVRVFHVVFPDQRNPLN